MRRAVAVLLLLPLLACAQTQVKLLKPPPPPVVAVFPQEVMDEIQLSTVAIVGTTLTFTLSKQPRLNSAITVYYVGSVYGSNTNDVVFPDQTQTPAQQKILIITLPLPAPAGGFTFADRIMIVYKTSECCTVPTVP